MRNPPSIPCQCGELMTNLPHLATKSNADWYPTSHWVCPLNSNRLLRFIALHMKGLLGKCNIERMFTVCGLLCKSFFCVSFQLISFWCIENFQFSGISAIKFVKICEFYTDELQSIPNLFLQLLWLCFASTKKLNDGMTVLLFFKLNFQTTADVFQILDSTAP